MDGFKEYFTRRMGYVKEFLARKLYDVKEFVVRKLYDVKECVTRRIDEMDGYMTRQIILQRNPHYDVPSPSTLLEWAVVYAGSFLAAMLTVELSEGVSLERLCLECMCSGLLYYHTVLSARGAVVIMIGGSACWYLNSVIQNKIWTVVMLSSLTMFPENVFPGAYLMGIQIPLNVLSVVLPILLPLSLVLLLLNVGVTYFKYGTSRRRGEDLLILVPILLNMSYVLFEDEADCWVLHSLIAGLIWIILKESSRQ